MSISARLTILFVIAIGLFILLSACSSDDGGVANPTGGSAQLTVQVQADFGTGKVTDHLKRLLANGCPEPAPATDQPDFPEGVDCDEDGGFVTFNTPSGFKVAIKKLSFIGDDGLALELIPDTGTLAASEVADLAETVTLFTEDIPAATYTAMEVDFYYYEVQMDMNEPATTENVRIYLSDDDFPGEGNGGHHQGDITLIKSDGTELGWAAGCAPWNESGALVSREGIVGAGGTDSETGHARGLYGDPFLWNQNDFMQGPDQDVFTLRTDLNLEVSSEAKVVTITFDLLNTWFFEDFDDNGLFNPGEGAEACSANSEWSPILPDINISID